jgi:Tropinone reductase 1
MIPLQRIGNSHDCAGLVEFLASDRSSYITGENLVVSGGINVRL